MFRLNKRAQSTGITWFFAILIIAAILVIYILIFTGAVVKNKVVSSPNINDNLDNHLQFIYLQNMRIMQNFLFSNLSGEKNNEIVYLVKNHELDSNYILTSYFNNYIKNSFNSSKLNCFVYRIDRQFFGSPTSQVATKNPTIIIPNDIFLATNSKKINFLIRLEECYK